MMGYYNGNGWSGWMVAMMMVWPIVLGLAIWAVVALTRDRAPRDTRNPLDPVDILNRRFASGEITQQEYVEARAVLNNENSREGDRSTA